MIVVELMGGLGNQMFQYAAGLSLAKKNNTDIYMDLSWYNNIKEGVTERSYELGSFNLAQNFILPGQYSIQSQNIINKIKNYNKLMLRPYIESNFRFDSKFFNLNDNTLLRGYFQTEKYFISIQPAIVEAFKIKGDISSKSVKLIAMANSLESVSLHVRRGDYVTSKNASQFHGLMNQRYYQKAIGIMNRRLKNPKYFIFSDEIQWVKNNFDLPSDAVYVTHNKSGIEDLRIMVACKHNIIANSSFSWWGAWLGQNIRKIVLAPKIWFLDNSIDTSDIIPSRWQRIQ